MRGGGVEGDVDELLDLRLQHAGSPGHAGEVEIGLEQVRVQLQQPVPEAVPVAAPAGEVGLQLLAALVERFGAVAQPLLFQHLQQQRHADVAGVDAEGGGQLQHLHDLLGARAVAEGGADVLADAGSVEVGGRGVHRDVDELLDLGRQAVPVPGHRRQAQIGLQESGVEPQHALPRLAPGAAHPDELVLDLLLAGGERHVVCSPRIVGRPAGVSGPASGGPFVSCPASRRPRRRRGSPC